MAFDHLPCGNPGCDAPGKLACGNCFLIKYCSKECQRVHYKTHKLACKWMVATASWTPGYNRQMRMPTFVTNDPHSYHGHVLPKYLCGNMPSFDHLKFAGLNIAEGDASLLFAASGDLRNAVTTIVGMKPGVNVNVVINDRESYVAIRNLFLLLLLGTKSETDDATRVDTAIHLWFSAFLTPAMNKVLIQVCTKHLEKMRDTVFDDKDGSDGLQETTLDLGNGCSVRCVFPRSVWKTLFAILDSSISSAAATKSRHKITLIPSRVDYRDRYLESIHREYRNSAVKYWDDGMVLPFGIEAKNFTVPNCTLFDYKSSNWLLMDSFNPLNCWPVDVILKPSAQNQAPKHDVYGLLYFYLTQHLTEFCERLTTTSSAPVKFTVTCCLAQDISTTIPEIEPRSFDLIDVSNLTDCGYLGVHCALRAIAAPLLKPSGRMIGLFLNYAAELEQWLGPGIMGREKNLDVSRLMKMMGKEGMQKYFRTLTGGPDVHRILSVVDAVADHDAHWVNYSRIVRIKEAAEKERMKMMKMEMPYRYNIAGNRKLQGKPEKVMEILLNSGLSGLNGHEAYAVWERK